MRFPIQSAVLALALLAGVLQRITEAAPTAANAAPLAGAPAGDPSASSSHFGRLENVGLDEGAPFAAPGAAEAEIQTGSAQETSVAQTDVACRYVGPLPELEGATRLAAFRQRVAEIELLVDIDREFEEAERQLDLLRIYATASDAEGGQPWEGQAEAVVLITTRLAELQLARRAPERAVRTLSAVLPVRLIAGLVQDAQFEVADKALRERETAWLADPRVVALRARAEAERERRRDSASTVSATPVADELTDEIWRDLQQGSGELVKAMGSAAVPALRELTLRSITGIDAAAVADQARDPLYWLLRESPTVALEVVLANLEGTPLIWRKRIVRALMILRTISGPRRLVGDRLRLDEPRWLDVLDGLVTDAQLWEDLVPLLRTQSQFNDWSPVQAAAVRVRLLGDDVAAVRALRETPPWMLKRFVRVDPEGRGVPMVAGMRQLELLEAGLLAESMEARELSASFLEQVYAPLSFLGRLQGASTVVKQSFLAASDANNTGFRRATASPSRDAWIDEVFGLARDEDRWVRLSAVGLLAHPGLRDHVAPERLQVFLTDEDSEVRGQLLLRFERRNKERTPTTEAEFELLRALAGDTVPEVRSEALIVAQMSTLPTRFTPEELHALAGDESIQVRSMLPWIDIGDDAVRVEIYRRLAGDPEEDVLRSLENRIESHLREDESTVREYLPVFAARLANPVAPWLKGTDHPAGSAHKFLETGEGLEIALAHLRSTEGQPGLGSLLRYLQRTRGMSQQLTASCLEVSAPELEFLLYAIGLPEYVPANVNSSFLFRELAEALVNSDRPNVGAAMTGASTDPRMSRIVRNYAFAWRMQTDAKASTEALIAYLSDPAWESVEFGDNEMGNSLRRLATAIDPQERNAIALRVIQTPEIGEYLAATVIDRYSPELPGGVEVSRAALKRLMPPETTYCRAGTALRHLGGVPGEVDPDLLRLALKIGNVNSIALGCIAQLKDPQYLPDLLECLNPSWIGYHETRHAFAKETAFAISQFMTDEASEALLEGVQVAENEEVRQACFDALERIRLYQEARERIGRREVGKDKRDSAVRELVAMLEDADAGTVAAAIKSLAALGAVDELPALIRLRKHADAGVRAAAEAAIERLTQAAPADGK